MERESESAGKQVVVPRHLRILVGGPIATAYKINYLGNFYSGPIYSDLEKEFGLARPEFIVLLCLGEMGELTAKQIIEASGRPRNSISRAVIRLLKQGLIAGETCSDDRRRQNLRMSGPGRKLLAKVMPRFVDRQREMLSVLTSEERRTLDRLLKKVAIRSDGWERIY